MCHSIGRANNILMIFSLDSFWLFALDPSSKNFYHAPPDRMTMPSMNFLQQQADEDDGLGPLPPKWEKAYTENGETYFIE